MRDLFLESETAEPVQANREPASRAGLSRPIHVSGYDRKVGDFYDFGLGHRGASLSCPVPGAVGGNRVAAPGHLSL